LRIPFRFKKAALEAAYAYAVLELQITSYLRKDVYDEANKSIPNDEEQCV